MCNYNFDLPVDPIPLLAMVKQKIEENGGRVTGQVPDVSVSLSTPIGPVEGNCAVVGKSTVRVTVTKKPDLVTCAMVREKLVYYVTEAVKMYYAESKALNQEKGRVAA